MIEPVVANFAIPAPLPLFPELPRPVLILRTSLRALCDAAGVELRVTGGKTWNVFVHRGRDHYYTPVAYYVGVETEWRLDRVGALRVLEILAYGFNDYAARESVCGRGLFSTPKRRRGRPPLHGRAMTARERMRRMRRRRARKRSPLPAAR